MAVQSVPVVSDASPLALPLGGGHLELDGTLEGRYVQRVHSSTPREDPEGKLRLRAGADLASRLRLESAVTAVAGGLPRDPRGAGVFDFDGTLQDLSPSLDVEEAHLSVYLRALDLRAGIQKFAWGKLDAIQPNDLLNPEKFYDPILEDENDRKVGIPALSATVHVPPLPGDVAPENVQLSGVWAPIVVPFRFPDDDERWYPPLARVPSRSQANGFTVETQARLRDGDVPERDLANGAGAARLGGFFRGVDFSFYYYDGYDTQPSLDVDVRGFVTFNPLNPGCVPVGADPDCFDVRSEIDVFPVFQRVRAAGADFAYNLLGATIRAEAAWVKNRLYARTIREVVASQDVDTVGILLAPGQEQEVPVTITPVNVRRDGVEWGFGGDYLFFGTTFFLVQMNQTMVLDNDVDLLISDTETRIATTVRRSFLGDRLEAELIGYYGLQGVYGMAHPRLTYDLTDYVDLRIGYVLLAGHEESILGQYERNDQGYVRVRLSF
ncbi:MAG: hypothetical protein ACREQ9_22600 [Candidatus Binatia bacterium]